LRTPITRMRLQAEMMPRTKEVDELIEDLSDMDHMLEEYLAFARGQGAEATVMTDIGGLITEIVERARRGGRDVGLDLRGDLWLSVRRNAIKRCIANLVGNAIDYGSQVAVIAHRTDDHVEIAVDDDGPGIPEARIEDAFKPFSRLDESRNLDKGGVGLGLAIAQDVARGHGGELKLMRSPWGGLRALLRLPI
jgi:two-component system osmolarity sensor histidine kinase EnvZ